MIAVLTSILLGAVVAAALHDLVARTVPGLLCLFIAGGGLLLRWRAGDLGTALLAVAVVGLVTTYCWRRGWLGGGDVKLLAAVVLAVPPRAVPGLVAGTAIAGAGLALVFLAARRWVRPPLGRRPVGLLARAARVERWRLARGGPLPYAVAIGIGTAHVLLPCIAAPASASIGSRAVRHPEKPNTAPPEIPDRAAAIARLTTSRGTA